MHLEEIDILVELEKYTYILTYTSKKRIEIKIH